MLIDNMLYLVKYSFSVTQLCVSSCYNTRLNFQSQVIVELWTRTNAAVKSLLCLAVSEPVQRLVSNGFSWKSERVADVTSEIKCLAKADVGLKRCVREVKE